MTVQRAPSLHATSQNPQDSSGHHVPLPIALNVAAGPVEAVNEADRNGIEAGIEDNWNGRGRHLGCKRRGDVGGSD